MSDINNVPTLEQELSPNKAALLLAGSAASGILFNILFYDKMPGISIPLFIAGLYAFFFYLIRDKLTLKADMKGLLLLVIALLSSTFALFSNPILLFFNVLALPILIASHTILVSESNAAPWHSLRFISDLICEGIVGAIAYVFKPFTLIATFLGKHKNPKGMTTAYKVLMGILISIPIVFIVLGLLSSADAVFNDMLRNMSDMFIRVNLNTFIAQLLLILIVSMVVFSYVWNLTIADKRRIIPDAERKTGFRIDSVIMVTVLCILCSIYLLFISIQFTYLFGSVSFKLPANLTYAAYARKGFFELVMVTVINLSVLLVALYYTKTSEQRPARLVQLLETLLVASTMVILFSAHFRMSLYEKVYGYTYLRFFTHAFMLYLFTLLAAVAIRLWYERLELSKCMITISLLAFTMINFVNADKIIAERNTAAYERTGKIDVHYLTELSYDGIPYMVDVLEDMKKTHPGSTEAKTLENHLYFSKRMLNKPTHWQSFNLSASKARKLLADYPLTYRPVESGYDFMD